MFQKREKVVSHSHNLSFLKKIKHVSDPEKNFHSLLFTQLPLILLY